MTLSPTDLDGAYRVSSVSSYDGPLAGRSDGVTEIRGGRTRRTDANGVVWTSTFTPLEDGRVRMVSVADPTDAAGDFALVRPDGAPTRAPVTYETVLRCARKGADIQMSGQIDDGREIVFVTLRRTGD